MDVRGGRGKEGRENEGREGKLPIVILQVEAFDYHRRVTCPKLHPDHNLAWPK